MGRRTHSKGTPPGKGPLVFELVAGLPMAENAGNVKAALATSGDDASLVRDPHPITHFTLRP